MDPFEELAATRSGHAARAPAGTSTSSSSVGAGHSRAAARPAETALIDLMPPELAAQAVPQPMRRAPPPPPSAVRQDSAVDGLSQATLDTWFDIADSDRDGRVANAEAVHFFLQSGLSPVELRKIYLLVKTPELNAREGVGLNKLRFAQMLRLVALAQSGLPFTEENAAAALDATSWLALHGRPLPAPVIVLRSASTPSPGHLGQQPAVAAASDPFGSPFGAGGSLPPPATMMRQPLAQAPVQPAGGNPFVDPAGAAGPAAAAVTSAGGQGAAEWQGLNLSALESMVAPPPHPAAAAGPSQPSESAAATIEDDDDLFGLSKLALREGPAAAAAAAAPGDQAAAAAMAGGGEPPQPSRQLSRCKASIDEARNLERGRTHTRISMTEAPLAFEVRLPPLNPKQSAKLSMLAAGGGSLFAGPGSRTGVLQWAEPEGNLRPPAPADAPCAAPLPRLSTEDSDAAPCAEVHVTARKEATCLLVDPAAGVLWVGDKDGWVSGYDISQPGVAVGSVNDQPPQRLLYQWEAYGVGSLSAMCVTPSGELWTGSSRGNIRLWQLQPKTPGGGPPMHEPLVCRELRRPLGERPHGGPVLALTCPSDGQVVWSTSGKTILIWEAASGAFLGIVQKMMGKLGQGLVIDAAMGQAEALLKYTIKPTQGLETDPVTGAILRRGSAPERARLQTDQLAWATQTDKSMSEFVERVSMGGRQMVQGAGKAMKFIGKFSAKVARNFGGAESDAASSKSGGSGYGAMADDEAAVGRGARSFNEDRSSRVCSLVATHDNHVWVGYNKGRVDRFTATGKLVWSKEISGSLQTMSSVGRHVWVGFANGMLSILESDGQALKVFNAHSAGIISMAQAGTRTYTLAADGSIKGWSSALPDEADADVLVEWDEVAASCMRQDTLHVLCVTWNVGESKPAQRSPFFTQLDGKVNSTDTSIQLVVVGLQEIEMGGSSVAMAAAKDALSYRLQERGNTNAKFWSASILEALGAERWYQVALRQLSGMLVLVFARSTLKSCIGEVATASVACGVLGVGGNKGAVAVEFSLHRRRVASICSHFAAHQKMVKERNANYEQIVKQLAFKRKPWYAAGGSEEDAEEELGDAPSSKKRAPAEQALALDEAQSEEGYESPTCGAGGVAAVALEGEELIRGEGVRNARLLVWLGDFNYRIDDLSYLDVKERITRERWEELLAKDQCRQQWEAGNVFRGMQEGPILFRPTYKFDKGDSNPEAYDTSEKQRIPAWCDRVFFRGTPAEEESLASERVAARALEYNCWLDVLDSDHKPVYARLEVVLPVTNRERKREICAQLLQRCAAPAGPAAGALDAVTLSPLGAPLQGVRLTNGGQHAARFRVTVDRPAAALLGEALDPLPASGLVLPGEVAEVHLLLGRLEQGALQARSGEAKVVVEPQGGWDPKDAATLRWVDGEVLVQPEYSRGSQQAQKCTLVRRFRVVWRRR